MSEEFDADAWIKECREMFTAAASAASLRALAEIKDGDPKQAREWLIVASECWYATSGESDKFYFLEPSK